MFLKLAFLALIFVLCATWRSTESVKQDCGHYNRTVRPGTVMCVYPKMCSCPPVTGTASFLRLPQWYYNNRTGTCEEFTWHGQDGNCNNFNTSKQCWWYCNIEKYYDHYSGEEE
uniref:Putative bpti/kunitz family of serine protease inhibitor n=1 Tax=Amblyomma tuberculatum TaxID=48802 RepID=A0A6M2E519_9ACAR